MYSTCLFCHSDLGANEVIEHFPVGRRLAFDEEKGRLWVICRSCERWNLTPLEERWEAIEECERLFRGTSLRMSTDHIGLARVSEGLELVRVGHPQRPEMAAWRYGDQFGRRRRKYYIVAAGGVVAVGAIASGYAALGLFAGGGGAFINGPIQIVAAVRNRRVIARVPTPEGIVPVTRGLLSKARIIQSGSDWELSLAYRKTRPNGAYNWWAYKPRRAMDNTVILDSRDALPALAAILPTVNGSGGSKRNVQSAVKLVEEAGSASKLLKSAVSLAAKPGWNAMTQGKLSKIPIEARLALEMVTHEDDERRALEGELAVLEARWKEAEEIAGISDNMFLPASVTEWIRKVHP